MQKLFSITVGKKQTEFAVVGIAVFDTNKAMFRAQIDGVDFAESEDYDYIRARLMRAVEIHNRIHEAKEKAH